MLTAELIHKALKKDAKAEKEIFQLCYKAIFSCCARYVKKDDEAEDATLTAFLKFYLSLPNFIYNGEKATIAFIKKIAINECLMILRQRSSFLIVDLNDENGQEIQNEALNNITSVEIHTALTNLPLGYRIVFNLFEIEGYSHAEISELLGITVGTSKSQLSKAKKMLQKKLISKEMFYARK